MYENIYLITNEENQEILKNLHTKINEKQNCKIYISSHDKVFEDTQKHEKSLFLLYLDDFSIKEFFKNHIDKNIPVAILPNEECLVATKNYAISKNIDEALDDAFDSELLSSIDLLKCNDSIALNRVSVGDMHGMNRVDYNKNTRFKKFKIFLKNLRNISFKSYTLTTSKEHSIKTAASGITILEHSTKSNPETAIRDELSIHDGKLNAYILAPTSLLSYIWYLISIFFYQRISLLSLPKSLGFIKSTKLTISSKEEINYKIDNVQVYKAQSIELEVLKNCLSIHLGKALKDVVKNDQNQVQEKDVIKINSLPKEEVSSILIGGKLPLFKKASDDDFKELLVSLKDSAKFSYTYVTLMILSTLIATIGLFANSTAVIIGAMILAPLMAPIISLSMGVIRADNYLLLNSVKTLSLGIFMALFVSCIFTLFIPLEQITTEMQGRLNPNLLDLLVAIFSGIAGAYATSKEEVAKSLAGVAIAVALVPPLSVTGIGLGLGNIEMIYGSFLLFITNLVGIALTASLTFIVLGFAPVKKAKKGVFYTTVLMALITIPLYLSFMKVVEKNQYFNKLTSVNSMILDNQKVVINIKTLENKKDEILVNMEVVSSKQLEVNTYKQIKEQLEKIVNKKVVLKIAPIIEVK